VGPEVGRKGLQEELNADPSSSAWAGAQPKRPFGLAQGRREDRFRNREPCF